MKAAKTALSRAEEALATAQRQHRTTDEAVGPARRHAQATAKTARAKQAAVQRLQPDK
ncbi:hypothetical protein [Kitasatospora sp. Root107]|uniref:hypothetical protein n=1 Tax=Kitasatospora sp. Root107 TaxID=1736424 RepID=UPI000B23B30E|nr:hypothetical protein [Kitasatospora sp. Root107]